MKKRLLKRLFAMMLVLVMVFSLGACDDNDSKSSKKEKTTTTTVEENNGGSNNGGSSNGGSNNGGSANGLVKADSLSDPNLRYVMIYNPKIYDENSYTDVSLKVGTLGNQVDVYASRGDGLEEDQQYSSISQREWFEYFSENMQLDDNRAEPMGIDYKKGDKHDFYYSSNGNLRNRDLMTFTCNYAGEYCYIWTLGDVSQSAIDGLGGEFDNKIYEEVVDTFGTPRFVGETGKVNILIYDMSGGLLGYFAPADLFVESEHSSVGLTGMTCNTGHAIININARWLENSSDAELAYSTAAHEFQHLVNFSAFFYTSKGAQMNTWLNEGMSGYIETEIYSNSKELSGHYRAFNNSDLIRNGQSLYNFDTEDDDIGVYGSVYYFSKYLEKIAGKNIFSDIMDYWRDSYSYTLNTSEALAESVSSSVYTKIDNSIDYSALGIRFNSEADEWMSKLTLNFYLSALSNSNNISVFNKIDTDALLYDSISGASIEGGGRLIVALSGDTFEIPSNSDDGLIYIGLDANFKPITNYIYQ